MREDCGVSSPFIIWMYAIRPKTLPAATAPVIVGSALAFRDSAFQFGPAIGVLCAALLLQIGANLANDVFDYRKGADNEERLGPVRVTQAGLLTPEQVLKGMWVSFGIAALCGVYLTFVAGWIIVLIGLLSIAAAAAYTGGPYPLGYYGLGDLFVFLFFGLVAVCGTYYVQEGGINPSVFWASVPMGLLITAILVVNNLRDMDTDEEAGKKTMAVRLGITGTRLEYSFCIFGAYVVPLCTWIVGMESAWIFLVLLSSPLALSLLQKVWHERGRDLNPTLGRTGQLTLLYSLLFSTGVIFSYFMR
ncbi:1,4-dihydroxy-2-naphthoate polyprenyltransferase [Chloroflexota bacterium]